MRLLVSILALCVAMPAAAQFRFRELNDKSLELAEGGAPVFVFNNGVMLKEGVPADRARCCYLHPVYAPNGAVVTDDFPADHFHHRGIHWTWPVVVVDGQKTSLWDLRGILPRFEKWTKREAGKDSAVLAFEDGWYMGDRKVVAEEIEIVAHPARNGRRDLDFTLRFRAMGSDVSIAGTPDQGKGYGGFNVRFAARTNTRIRTPDQADAPDSDLKPQPWAEVTGDFAGKPAGVRVTMDPANPPAPGWCLRHYGFLGVEFPGLQPYSITKNAPLVLKYRVTLSGGAQQAAHQTSKGDVLVYTRNGKGYVHENIADSVAAIKKMGAENGFGVDVTDDTNFLTDAHLKLYKAIVFANTNNEAFTTENQRGAFQRFIEAGGGFVGIHSASGSERAWPFYWSLIGGSFLYHPKLQPFTVRVTDRDHSATRHLPATFEWEDECYHLQYMNPNLHPLLVTDSTKLTDPDRDNGKYPFELVGKSLPLSWTLTQNGGRHFYTSLGHKKEHYSNPILYQHILGGILWAMGQ